MRVVGGSVGAIVSFLFSASFPLIRNVYEPAKSHLGAMAGMGIGFNRDSLSLLHSPSSLSCLLRAGIVHLCLMIVGGSELIV